MDMTTKALGALIALFVIMVGIVVSMAVVIGIGMRTFDWMMAVGR